MCLSLHPLWNSRSTDCISSPRLQKTRSITRSNTRIWSEAFLPAAVSLKRTTDPMRFRYSKWTPQSMTDEQRLQSLASLFSYLLIQTSGDVEEAIEWLRQLAQEYGILDENLTIEGLIEKLKEMGIIEEAKEVLKLTTKGVQRIRQDALREIFTSLRKGGIGYHETPQTGTGIDRLSETKKWTIGDAPTNIDLTST